MVEVKLASDTGPLAATKVDVGGDCEDNVCDVKIAAPLQAVDLTAHTVTVLGLVVNISGATLQDENGQPITADQLAGGQFVELTLDSAQLPSLVATLLEVQNPTTGVYVEVIDEKGRPVNDGAVNDVQADVTVKHAKKILKFHTTSNGSFRLAGLPTGQAKIVVTRVDNGHKSKASGLVGGSAASVRCRRKAGSLRTPATHFNAGAVVAVGLLIVHRHPIFLAVITNIQDYLRVKSSRCYT